MNVMGELVSLVGLAALAGIIIGWCIRNFFGGSEKRVRQHFAHDIDEAVKDAQHLRRTLDSKNDELRDTKTKLQQLRRKGGGSEIDTRIQVAEINELKKDLATSRKTLMDNQAEFSTYRTKSEKDQSELRKELSKYTAGGAASTERLTEANETIGALRSAVRENDKVIDSLRNRPSRAVARLRPSHLSTIKKSKPSPGKLKTRTRPLKSRSVTTIRCLKRKTLTSKTCTASLKK